MPVQNIFKSHATWLSAAAIAVGVGLTGCGAQEDGASETGSAAQIWRFALEETEGGVQWQYAQKFKEIIEENTDNVSVEIYPYGTLGTSQDITQQIRNNNVQIAFASAGHVGSTVPEAQVFSLNFLFSPIDEVNNEIFWNNETVFDLLSEAYSERGLQLLSIVPAGWMVWSSNSPIQEPSDFQGLSVRVMPSELLLATYEAYGANPRGMAYSEVYGGLQQGVIDAQVQPMFAMRDMSFYEVQDYMIEGDNALFVTTVITNPNFLDALPAEQQELIWDAKAQLDPYIYEQQVALNKEAGEEIRANSDTQFLTLNEEQKEAFRAKVEPVFDKFVDIAGPRGERILKEIQRAVAEGEKNH